MVTQKFDLNMIPGKPKPIIRASQYDTGLRAFEVSLFAGTDTYTIPSGATLTVQGTKPDYTGFSYSATYSGNTVSFDCTDQMTACAGAVEMEIAVVNDGERVATANFVLQVEAAALKDDTIISETDIPIIEKLPEMMEDMDKLISTFGGPNVAETAAEMTDQDKVYVYIGSETGYNSGHWYYYDKTARMWKDGGIYQSAGMDLDTTLTVSGKAADAKAVGDALALKANLASPTFTGYPKAPTASLLSYGTQIANTEFVKRLTLPLEDAVKGLEPTEVPMHLVVDGTTGTWEQGGKTYIYNLLPGDEVKVTAGERDAYLVWYTTQGGTEAVDVSTSHTVTAGSTRQWGTTDAKTLAVLMEDTSGNDVSPAFFAINGVEKGLNERVDALETTKQDTLTFDSTPTEGSANPVTSGGVWEAIQTDKTLAVEDKAADAKATGDIISGISDTTAQAYFSNLGTPKFAETYSSGKLSSVAITFPDAEFQLYKADGTRLVATTGYTRQTFTINNLTKLIYDTSAQTISVVSTTVKNANAVTLLQVCGDNVNGCLSGYYYAVKDKNYDIPQIKALSELSAVSVIDYDGWQIGSLNSDTGQPISSTTRVRSLFYDISTLYGFEVHIATGFKYIVFFYDESDTVVNINNLGQWNTTKTRYFASEWGSARKIRLVVADVSNGQAALAYARNATVYVVNKINDFARELDTLNSTKLCVMSFNVQKWTGLNSNYPLMADIIYKYAPDILCVQEQASNPGAISNSLLVNYRNYYQSSGITTPIGIYSKYSLETMETVIYQTQGSETRGYIHATFTYNKNTVHVFNTHLDLDVATRHAQATELFNAAKLYDYAIVCGDFNSFEASSESGADYTGEIKQYIEAGMHSLNCSNQHGFLYTYHNGNTIATSTLKHCLDQIFTTSNIDINKVFVDKSKDSDSNASYLDHFPIIAYCHVNG